MERSRLYQGTGRHYTIDIFKEKKYLYNSNDSCAHLSKPSILPTPVALIFLLTPQTLSPSFLDILLSCTENSATSTTTPCPGPWPALQTLSAPLGRNPPIICHEPVNWVLIVLLEEKERFYMQKKKVKMN